MIKRILCLTMAVLMTLSLAACGTTNAPETTQGNNTPETTLGTTPAPETNGEAISGSAVTYFSMSLGADYENVAQLIVYPNEDGTAYVEYRGEVRKQAAALDGAILNALSQQITAADLAALNGKEVYEEGDANGSMYISFADETMLSANFSGNVAQEYKDAFAAMQAWFQTQLADVPEYVPTPMLNGEVNADALAEANAILNASGIAELDTLMISDVPMDENFNYTMGLSSSEGITNGTSVTAMMMTVPYTLVIATVEDASKVDAIAQDFEASLNWQKGICVTPEKAMIATKGNLVLCLMGSDTMFSGTADAIKGAEWTVVKELSNPMM